MLPNIFTVSGPWLSLLKPDMMKATASKACRIQAMMLRTEGLMGSGGRGGKSGGCGVQGKKTPETLRFNLSSAENNPA
jgi:hypothetical protein